jgi:hypothetical protein
VITPKLNHAEYKNTDNGYSVRVIFKSDDYYIFHYEEHSHIFIGNQLLCTGLSNLEVYYIRS